VDGSVVTDEVKKLAAVWQTLMTRASEKNTEAGGKGGCSAAGYREACIFAAVLIEGVLGPKLAEPLTTARDHITRHYR
jgi:hypothetical protein